MLFCGQVGIHALWLGTAMAVMASARCCPAQEETGTSAARHSSLKVSTSARDARPLDLRHPLESVIDTALRYQQQIRQEISDYTCYLVKRERIGGELLEPEHMFVKFRAPHELEDGQRIPFSIYARVLAPKRIANREVLFVKGRYRGDMLVTRGGRRHTKLTLQIDPEGGVAMRDNRYALTDFGMDNLLTRLINVAKADLAYDECQVRVLRGARVDGRSCTAYTVTHPVPRAYFRYHLAQVFVDDQLQVPVRFASYSWPATPGDDPVLEEEYTYRYLKLNVGLTDEDFDPGNPEYGFSLRD